MRRKIKVSMLGALTATVIGFSLLCLVFLKQSLQNLPSVDSLESYVPPLVTTVTDAYGLSVGEFFTERRTTVPLTQIPLDLRRAVMAVEDSAFYDHWGVDIKGIMRAMMSNIKAGRIVQGGSTLTQQLAKTIFLTRQKTFIRKFKELLLTLQIEHRYSKDEILQLYLNQIYFGAGAYGVEAAAQLYFDKRAHELTLPECALLAGLIRSPNRYSPLRYPDRAGPRRAVVLSLMEERGYITETEEEEANQAPLVPEGAGASSKQAHYFLEEIKKDLEPKYGAEMLEQGGLTIQTTLDLNMQQAAERILTHHTTSYDIKHGTSTLFEYNKDILTIAEREHGPQGIRAEDITEPVTLFEGTTYQVTLETSPPHIQAALVALDIHTGAIRAMVGGSDFFKSQFNRAVQAKRQPGSSFKTFVWAAALEKQFTAATVVNDNPLVYIDMESDPTLLAETTSYADSWLAILDNLQMSQEEFTNMDPQERKELLKRYWRPQNYDHRFLGPITLRRALERSRNIISVRIIDSIGPRAVAKLANESGIKSHLEPVLSLALGTSVVSLLELANAYGTFAAGGLHAEPYYVDRILDRRGNILEENQPQVSQTVDPVTSFLITNLLQGVVNHGTGWYARRLRRPLGGKTGTTQDQRDVFFVGFSADLVCAVWMGYDDFRPLRNGYSASKLAVPFWTDFMREALKNDPKKDFPIPLGIEFAKVDTNTGFLALPTCPKVTLEAFRRGTVPDEFCPYDHLSKN